MLAEGLGEKLSPQRLTLNVQALIDMDRPALERAFARAHRECKFFPKPAELREMCEGSKVDQETVEAQRAWEWIVTFMRKWWHPDIGVNPVAPEIPYRVRYALRYVGGFRSLSQMDVKSEQFLKRDFLSAYRLAPLAESMAPNLERVLPAAPQVRQLAAAKTMPEKQRASVEDINSARDRMLAAQLRAEEARAERLEAGRKRHDEQVQWLREKGML